MMSWKTIGNRVAGKSSSDFFSNFPYHKNTCTQFKISYTWRYHFTTGTIAFMFWNHVFSVVKVVIRDFETSFS